MAYSLKPFGGCAIPKDWLFYTPLARRLQQANNEEALQDLCDVIARIRRSRMARYRGILGCKETTTIAGVEKRLRGKE